MNRVALPRRSMHYASASTAVAEHDTVTVFLVHVRKSWYAHGSAQFTVTWHGE